MFDLKKQVPAMEQMAINRPHNQEAVAGSTVPGGARSEGSGTTTPAGQEQGPEAGFFKYGIADGTRLDTDGNIWAGTRWGRKFGISAEPHELVAEIAAWERQRNATRAHVKWMFTTERARTKLASAYPDPTKES